MAIPVQAVEIFVRYTVHPTEGGGRWFVRRNTVGSGEQVGWKTGLPQYLAGWGLSQAGRWSKKVRNFVIVVFKRIWEFFDIHSKTEIFWGFINPLKGNPVSNNSRTWFEAEWSAEENIFGRVQTICCLIESSSWVGVMTELGRLGCGRPTAYNQVFRLNCYHSCLTQS